MLYVFQVDTGTMLTFDMNSALDTTLALKQRLSEKFTNQTTHQQLTPSSLVLLTGTGSALSNNSPIHLYGTGTDVTNPIFLFNKTNIISSDFQQEQQQQQQTNNEESTDLQQQFISSISTTQNRIESLSICVTSLPPTYQTLALRSSCARRIYDVDKLIHQTSCRLFQDQNLQLNGWQAVISNLQESTGVFAKKIEHFRHEFIVPEAKAVELAASIREMVAMRKDETISELRRTVMSAPSSSTNSDVKKPPPLTLLDWLLSQDGSITSIDKLVDSCFRLIDKLDPPIIEGIQTEADSVIHTASNSPWKEIIGLDQRLEGMRTLLEKSREFLSSQSDYCSAFSTNESRFADVQDSSVLPDLCALHQQQMIEMARNHAKLEEIQRMLQKAKEELCSNINHRLKWVIITQKQIGEITIRTNVCSETLKKLSNYYVILKQVFDAGRVYRDCEREWGRRGTFAREFEKYHGEVRDKILRVTSEESARRESFLAQHGDHFIVQAIFPSLTNPLPDGINVPVQYAEPQYTDRNNGESELYDFHDSAKLEKDREELETSYKLKLSELEEKLKIQEEKHTEAVKKLAESHASEMAEMREKHRADQDALKARIRFFSRTASGGSSGGSQQQGQNSEQGQTDCVVAPLLLGSPTGSGFPSPGSEQLQPQDNVISSAGAATAKVVLPDQESADQIRQRTMSSEGENNVVVDEDEFNCDNNAYDDVDHEHDDHDQDSNDALRTLAISHGASLSSFKKGDKVLLYWSKKFDTYVAFTTKIIQTDQGKQRNKKTQQPQVNFVYNPNEIAALQMSQETLFMASVTSREFCVARRRSNTYKVPSGFHFYRLHLLDGSVTPINPKQ